ncbi:hypothetical protein ASC77_17070 [Nocardioides sp. Root1257]|uniref:DUF2149 domain-containing protein n=1 Tax=unclassified Nocardioides TaxID=2615069 RepID=UPI0006FC71F9|nr:MULTISPECIES: DUF2149 domain-containing protein [unclassified Nocardioides]KQW46911.1 hypothetical protein ASC77_17070 [Nocardioides sp. Root1257]KRC43658.1 hypothetical protein ASE24_18025 [Nocardioides sp. Root224]
MIRVSTRAHHREDRAGDPLDGLVNLFDLGIVLAVGFLLAALASLNLESAITKTGLTPDNSVTVKPDETSGSVPPDGEKVIGNGEKVGTVYRLEDGRLVYVVPKDATP